MTDAGVSAGPDQREARGWGQLHPRDYGYMTTEVNGDGEHLLTVIY